MSIPDPPPDDGTGGPIPHALSGQINDLRASVHHPLQDFLFPSALEPKDWLTDEFPAEELIRRVADQGLKQARKASSAAHPNSARQRRPDLQTIERELAELDRDKRQAQEAEGKASQLRKRAGDSA